MCVSQKVSQSGKGSAADCLKEHLNCIGSTICVIYRARAREKADKMEFRIKKSQPVLKRLTIALLFLSVTGCNSFFNGWLDPSQVGRFRGPAVTRVLRRSISIADEPEMDIQGEEPIPEDLMVSSDDYVMQPGDIIDLSIFELLYLEQPWVQVRQILSSGKIRIPQVKQDVIASGKTAHEFERYLSRILTELQLHTDPEVTVFIREARSASYNILGSVGAPRRNPIPQPNFRLLDALAAAGGVTPVGGARAPLIKYVYVTRSQDSVENKPTAKSKKARVESVEPPLLGSIENSNVDSQSGHWIWVNGEWKFVATTQPTTTSSPAGVERLPTVQTQPAKTEAEVIAELEEDVEIEGEHWEEVTAEFPQPRIIAVPLDSLYQFEGRYNIVIRNGDTIWVPGPMQGEVFIMGNINRPGVYAVTGRDMTLRQLISSAGGLSALADPSRGELVRRIGGNQEQVLSINVDRIFAGRDEDIILKPNDIINIGTNPIMPFLAVIRNAFRMTYGFGFLYDRNFADIDSYTGQSNPTDRRRGERRLRFGF